MTPKLSLILPVYNESRRIELGLRQAINYLSTQPYSWEIIVVNDGSTDNTAKMAAQLLKKTPKQSIFLLNIAQNMGKGHAIRIGVEAAEGQLIFFSDIDFSVSL